MPGVKIKSPAASALEGENSTRMTRPSVERNQKPELETENLIK
jgi:hypothetical protein